MKSLNVFNGRSLVPAIFLLLALLHLGIVILNHYYFRTFAYYYGVYNFAFFDFAHFRISPIPILFDGSNSTFLQDHFSLLLPVISPFYWLLHAITGTYTLLIVQWLAIVYGGWATYKLIAYKSHNPKMAALAMVTYFLMYCRFSSYQADCNLAIIGSALIPGFLYYFEKKNLLPLIIVFVILLITREDFSLWLSFICLSLVIVKRGSKKSRNLAALFLVISVLFFILIFKWIIPSLESETVKFALFNYAALGTTPFESLQTLLHHPFDSIRILFVNHLGDPQHDWIKIKFYLVFACSGGILLLLRPAYIICLIPLIAKKMFNDDPIRWSYETYYGIEVASILPALVFLTISDLKAEKIRIKLSILALVITVSTSVYCFWTVNYPMLYTKFEFYRPWFFERNYALADLHHALNKVPENAVVSASGRILPHLAFRQKIYYFPKVDDADYICLTIYGDSWPLSNEDYDAEVKKLKENRLWKIEYEGENAIIFKKTK
ncbi:MAG: DUF2079 domain-containing protein [bacterium]|nr:DUF2079 domain-containing protein [bacterium]